MSVTVAHWPHVRLPRSPAIAVLAIAAAAALVMLVDIQPSATPPATTHVEAIGAGEAVVWTAGVPRDRSPVVRAIVFGEVPAAAPAGEPAPLRKSARTPWLTGRSDGGGGR
jgi:hypothetical protein